MSSIVNYVADGSTTEFQIPFTYISDAHVVVTIDGTATSAFTFLNSSTLRMTTAPTAGSKLQIQRTTPVGALVDFTDGSTLFEGDLDLAHQQNRLIAEESKDIANVAKTTVDNNIADVNTVAGIAADVTNVASRGADVTSVADNMAEVLLADTNAATATTKAAEAVVSANTASAQAVISTTKATESSASAAAALASQNAAQQARTDTDASEALALAYKNSAQTAATTATTKASEASQSATTASSQAATATQKASEASTSATSAASSAASAQASKDAALDALDSFDDRYLGQKTADPTLDNDGNALVSGSLYFNTTDDIMKVYDGSLWVAAYASLSGAMFGANNLSDVADAAASRTNLGLGTAATTASTDYATAAQGTLADSATQPGDLATVATSGAYGDLSGTPTLGTAASSAATDFVAVTGDSMTGNLSFGDNDKAIFGAGSDLQIYHSGSHSYIQDVGQGNLTITAANFYLNNGADTENMISAVNDGAVSIRYNGATKLATTSSGCTITGDATATNFNTTSDQTLKTNVETLTGSLDAVKSLRGVSFDWIENGNSEVGVIAQEVEAVLPDVVSTNDEGIKSVKYSNMVAVLIEAIKEQQLCIEALETQLNS